MFRLEPQDPAPAGGRARSGGTRELEEAWNAYARTAFELDESRLELEARGAEAVSAAAHEAAGYERHVAAREAAADAEAFRAAERGARALRPASASEALSRLESQGHRLPRVVAAALAARAADAEGPAAAALILTTRKSVKRCRRRYVLIGCGCGAKLRPGGCGRVDCLNCYPQGTARRARAIFDRVTAGLDLARWPGVKDPRMYALRVSVLTMPPELRERYATAASWRKLRREVQRLFRERFGASMCVIASHPVGDEDPTVFHPHLNVLWSFDRPHHGFMPPAQLADLKRQWKRLVYRSWYMSTYRLFTPLQGQKARSMFRRRLELARRAGLAPRVPRRQVVDVWGQYVPRNEEKKLRHRARYYGRVFVGWKMWLPKAVQWYGAFPRTLPSYCDRCGAEWHAHHGKATCEGCGRELEGVTRQRPACPACRDLGRRPWFKILKVGSSARRLWERWRDLARGPAPPGRGVFPRPCRPDIV